jgi:O-antigen/teichoic acid export membrane protein
MNRHLLSGGLKVLTGSILQGVVRLAAGVAVARLAGPERQGTFALALTCINTGAVVLGFGLDYANMYLLGPRPEIAGFVASNSIAVGLVAALLGVVWSTGFALLVPGGLDGDASPVLQVLLLATGIGTLALQQSGQSLALGLRRLVALGVAGLIGGCVWLAAAQLVASRGVVPLLVGWIASTAIVPLYLLGCEVWRHGAALDRQTMTEQLRFGVRTVPAAIFRSLNLRLTLFLSAAYLPIAEVGIYAFVVSLAEAVLMVPSALGQVVLVAVAGRQSRDVERPVRLYLAVVLLPLLGAAAVAVSGGPGLALLAGNRYAAGATAFAVLLLGASFHGVGLIRLHVLMGSGHPGAAWRAQGVALIATAALGFVLVPRFGMLGAAATTLLAYAVFAAYLLMARFDARH